MFDIESDEGVAARRNALGKLGLLGLSGLLGCGGGASTGTGAAVVSNTPAPAPAPAPAPTPAPTPGACTLTPTEIRGPYPLLAVLSNSAIVRQDIREGKTGVPMTLTFTLEDTAGSCQPIANAAVYIWHCDKDGAYSGYDSSQGNNGDHAGETFLRGVQVTNADGQVTFTTIFPGWYAGRITHIHLQVYLNDALNVTATLTTQLAFPQSVTTAVYDSALYAARGQNNSVSSVDADMAFSDGSAHQIAAVSGDVASGLTATLKIGVAG